MFLLLRHSVLTLLFHHLPLFVKVFYLTKHENKEVDKVQQVAKCSRIEQDWKQKIKSWI